MKSFLLGLAALFLVGCGASDNPRDIEQKAYESEKAKISGAQRARRESIIKSAPGAGITQDMSDEEAGRRLGEYYRKEIERAVSVSIKDPYEVPGWVHLDHITCTDILKTGGFHVIRNNPSADGLLTWSRQRRIPIPKPNQFNIHENFMIQVNDSNQKMYRNVNCISAGDLSEGWFSLDQPGDYMISCVYGDPFVIDLWTLDHSFQGERGTPQSHITLREADEFDLEESLITLKSIRP